MVLQLQSEEIYSVLGSATGCLKLKHETKGWIRIANVVLQFLDVSKGFVLRASQAKNVVLHSSVSSLQFKEINNEIHEFILPDKKHYRMEYDKVTDASNFCTLVGNATHEQRKAAVGKTGDMAKNQQQLGNQSQEKGELIDSLINEFVVCVHDGDVGRSREIAQQLAENKVPLSVSQDANMTDVSKNDNTISLRISVEDRYDSSAKITLNVRPSISFKSLKEKMYKLYGFPPMVQRWIVEKRIMRDDETLKSVHIDTSGFMVYLYLVSAKTADVKKDEAERKATENQEVYVDRLPGDLPSPGDAGIPYMGATAAGPPPARLPGRPQAKTPPVKMEDAMRFVNQYMDNPFLVSTAANPKKKKTATEVGWKCNGCTMINAPRRPSCHMCSLARPDDYVLPPVGSYVLDPVEKRLIDEEEQHQDVLRQAPGELHGPGLLSTQRGGGDGLRIVPDPQSMLSMQVNSFD